MQEGSTKLTKSEWDIEPNTYVSTKINIYFTYKPDLNTFVYRYSDYSTTSLGNIILAGLVSEDSSGF